MGPKAKVHGRMLVISGVGTLLKKLSGAGRRQPYGAASGGTYYDPARDENSFLSNQDVVDGSINTGPNGEGPNHRGTYSKAYTLQHPEVGWVHRGQGRYLPSSTVKQQTLPVSTRKYRSREVVENDFLPVRTSLRRRSGETSQNEEALENTPLFPHSSPLPIRTPASSYSLRGRPSEDQLPNASDLRSARVQRRSRPVNSIEGGRRTSVNSLRDDIDEEPPDSEKTYTRNYVDAHPEFAWRHCGNGFYRKSAKPHSHSQSQSENGHRRDSNRSFVKAEREGSTEGEVTRTYHSSELKDFPGEHFRHCGNGWYKRESAGSNSHQPPGDSAPDSEEDNNGELDEMETMNTFSKEEMLEYKTLHPRERFVHRGNGRWRRIDDVITIADNAVEAEVTYDKAHVLANPDEKFHHCGYGRYKKGARPSRPSIVSTDDEGDELPIGLVGKDYVLAHPELTFHHRGQGRYALGARLRPDTELDPSTAEDDEELEAKEEVDEDSADTELVDTNYVNSHPNEDFHHRGQGRWARGLPPPGSSNKTAIRGPSAQFAKLSSTPSVSVEATNPTEPPPGPRELVFKIDGPLKFPELKWHYRGGGKWCRTSKQELEGSYGPSARRNKGNGKAPEVEGPSQKLESETQTADFTNGMNSSRGTSFNGTDALTTSAKRKRGNLHAPEDDSPTKRASKVLVQKPKVDVPKPQKLAPEDDVLTDEDFPQLYRAEWSPPATAEADDEAAKVVRELFKPLNATDAFVQALTKHDPAVRSTANLQDISAHAQQAIRKIQDEYLKLDLVTAPNARIARKPDKGGRLPLEKDVAEDRKEADLYDYTFDARKIGYQDPDAQKIVRDAEGRELRKRRNRGGLDIDSSAIPASGTEEVGLASRRAVKPVTRFDGVVADNTTRKKRGAPGTAKGSMTPDPTSTNTAQTAPVEVNGYVAAATGRWAGHVPKRIRELRGESVGAAKSPSESPEKADATPGAAGVEAGKEESPSKEGSPGSIRKGRPKGSKNLHKRRDAGIPKGPRNKNKVVNSIESPAAESGEEAEATPGPADGLAMD